MKIKRILLSIFLIVACLGCAAGAVMPSASFSADVFAKATVCVQEKASTIASTTAVRVNPAVYEDISTYDVHEKDDFRYETNDDGTLAVSGFSTQGYEKFQDAVAEKGRASVALPKDKEVTKVLTKAFCQPYIEKAYIPANITDMRTTAFHFVDYMEELYFEDGPEELVLYGQTFYGSYSLKEIYIPARVTYSSNCYDNPFGCAKSLEHIYVHPDNPQLTSRDINGEETDSVMFYKKRLDYQTSGRYIITGCKNTRVSNYVVGLGQQAFSFNALESITLPESLKRLEFEALAGTKLKTLVLPKNLIDMGQASLYDCRDLKSVVLPTCDFDVFVPGNNLDWMFMGTYSLQCLVAANAEKAAKLTELFREYGHLVTYEIEVIYHFMDGHVETDKKLFSRDLSWTLQEDGGWDVGTYALRPGTWADASGKELSYDDVNSLVSGGEVTSAINLYQTKLPDPVDPNDPNNPDKPVDPDNPDNPGDDGKVEGQGSKSTNGVVKNLWWIIPLVIAAVALLVWAAFALVAAITGVAGLAGFAALFAMIFSRRKEEKDDWLKRVLKIIRKKV